MLLPSNNGAVEIRSHFIDTENEIHEALMLMTRHEVLMSTEQRMFVPWLDAEVSAVS